MLTKVTARSALALPMRVGALLLFDSAALDLQHRESAAGDRYDEVDPPF